MNTNKGKTLVAYFSRKDQNYFKGGFVDLKKGNTEVAAEMAAELTGATLFEIRTEKEYPFLYNDCIAVAKEELQANARPALVETVDAGCYDTMILGFPSWYSTMPMAVFTFLEGQDLSGKTILPFCTNEGSGMGKSEKDLKTLCPDSDIRVGLSIPGSSVSGAKPVLEKWLRENGI